MSLSFGYGTMLVDTDRQQDIDILIGAMNRKVALQIEHPLAGVLTFHVMRAFPRLKEGKMLFLIKTMCSDPQGEFIEINEHDVPYREVGRSA